MVDVKDAGRFFVNGAQNTQKYITWWKSYQLVQIRIDELRGEAFAQTSRRKMLIPNSQIRKSMNQCFAIAEFGHQCKFEGEYIEET